jgi:rhamnosyltransferase
VDLLCSLFRNSSRSEVYRSPNAPSSLAGRRVALFSHFDKSGVVAPYVVYFARKLKQADFRIVFVSTSPRLDRTADLQPLCDRILLRENIGLDFGSWKVAAEEAGPTLHEARSVLLVNDSVVGPFFELDALIDYLEQGGPSLGGLTESQEQGRHLQSYFILCNGPLLRTGFLRRYLQSVRYLKVKGEIVTRYEVGLSQAALREKVELRSWVTHRAASNFPALIEDSISNGKHNLTLFYWEPLISKELSPFLKKSLFFGNPVDDPGIATWRKALEASRSSYPTQLISEYLRDQGAKYC